MADEVEEAPSSSASLRVNSQRGDQKICQSSSSSSKEGCSSLGGEDDVPQNDDAVETISNGNSGRDGRSVFDDLPDIVMQCIFETFDLRERCIAQQVCQRWHYLLTCRFPMEDVTVLNIFQNNIYEEKISNNKNIGLKCYHISEPDLLMVVLQHCRSVSSVKIWFWSSVFAGEVLNMLKQMKTKMRCLDLYPYRSEKALEEAFTTFPELTGMTMRPHGQDFFWSGLDLQSFPRFHKLDTLMLDGFNIKPEVFLPESLTTLEWLNRSGNFMVVMPKLKTLINLEYLLLGHAEFLNLREFDEFLLTINSDNLPRLQYLIFRYCKIDAHKLGNEGSGREPQIGIDDSVKTLSSLHFSSLEVKLQTLQMIKLDLCYGNLNYIIRKMVALTSSNFRAISLNVISEETNYERIYEIADFMFSKKLVLHFGMLQKDMRSERNVDASVVPRPPPSFGNVLGRFEASFVTDTELLKTLLLTNPLTKLSDVKFIQSMAVSNTILFHLAMFAPRLRKLSLINCNEEKLDAGLVHFVAGFPSRVSKCLQIIWKRKRSRPAAFYLQLINDHASLIEGYGARFLSKRFSANKDGERITIWDKKIKKYLFIQDFDINDQGRILGIVMPPDGVAPREEYAAWNGFSFSDAD